MDLEQAFDKGWGEIKVVRLGASIGITDLQGFDVSHLANACQITVRGEPLIIKVMNPPTSFNISYHGNSIGPTSETRQTYQIGAVEVLREAYEFATNLPTPLITRDSSGKIIDVD